MTDHTIHIPMGRKPVPWNPSEKVVVLFSPPRGVPPPPLICPQTPLPLPFGSPTPAELAVKAEKITVILLDSTRLWQDISLVAATLRQVLKKGKPFFFSFFDEGLEQILPRVPPGPLVYVSSGNCIVLINKKDRQIRRGSSANAEEPLVQGIFNYST